MREMITAELTGKFSGVESGMLVDYQGLSALELGEFRGSLRENEMQFLVVNNSLLKIAFQQSGKPDISGMMTGPTGLVWGGDDPSAAAHVLADWNKKNKAVKIKGGFFEDGLLSKADVQKLSNLPDRDTLRAMVAGLVAQPMQNIASAVNNIVAQVIWAVDAVKEKKEE
jgi:large subunit ribosomal protein L10